MRRIDLMPNFDDTALKVIQYQVTRRNPKESTLKEIAEAVGCSPQRVSEVLYEFGSGEIIPTSTYKAQTYDDLPRIRRVHGILALIFGPHSYVQIGECTDTPVGTVRRHLDQYFHLVEAEDKRRGGSLATRIVWLLEEW